MAPTKGAGGLINSLRVIILMVNVIGSKLMAQGSWLEARGRGGGAAAPCLGWAPSHEP